ncbi:hypothetical protein CVM73_35215 [Bradyrhizobium forestalis]|uniref:HTH iclR-type domain-containing protein n=1 Tax=Bradyrhizobium forestalis TaxID=1419263 RepID=A0A2M8QYL8_9BRAD|nr:hypothetical protein CVM73_35215 [Bradyrhizobium forestalis]
MAKRKIPATRVAKQPREANAERNQVTALARGLAILRCFTRTRPELGSTEIARLTCLPQPTVWRLCQTLVQSGFLSAASDGLRFRLGAAVLELGFIVPSTVDILEEVQPRMKQIARTYGAEIAIAGRDALDMVCLERWTAGSLSSMNPSRRLYRRRLAGPMSRHFTRLREKPYSRR